MTIFDSIKSFFWIYTISEKILMKMLWNIDIFKWYSKSKLYKLIKKFYLNDYKDWSVVVKQNTKPDIIWIVQEWILDVMIIQPNWEKNKLWEIKEWWLYAEMSFFNNKNTMATIVAGKDTIVWEITTIDFAHFLKNDPKLFDSVRNTIKNRIQVNKVNSNVW